MLGNEQQEARVANSGNVLEGSGGSVGARVLRVLLASMVLIVVAVGAKRAAANTFGPDASPCNICYNENGSPRFFWTSSLGGEWLEGADWARRWSLGDPTDISTSVVGDHDNSDWAVYKGDYGQGEAVAWVDCVSYVNNAKCAHWHIFMNQSWGPYPLSEKKHIACHEYGHAVGLNHWNIHTGTGSCMENGVSDSPQHKHFTDHDINHIDGRY